MCVQENKATRQPWSGFTRLFDILLTSWCGQSPLSRTGGWYLSSVNCTDTVQPRLVQLTLHSARQCILISHRQPADFSQEDFIFMINESYAPCVHSSQAVGCNSAFTCEKSYCAKSYCENVLLVVRGG